MTIVRKQANGTQTVTPNEAEDQYLWLGEKCFNSALAENLTAHFTQGVTENELDVSCFDRPCIIKQHTT